MSGESDDDPPFQSAAQAEHGARPGEAATEGLPPYGWYYFGPEPPLPQPDTNVWQGGPYGHGHAGETRHQHAMGGGASPFGPASDPSGDLKEAFDRLSRGDLSADTIGKLLNLNDRDFWTGALVGAAAALLASNLPTLMNIVSGLAKQSSPQSDRTAKAKGDSEQKGATASD